MQFAIISLMAGISKSAAPGGRGDSSIGNARKAKQMMTCQLKLKGRLPISKRGLDYKDTAERLGKATILRDISHVVVSDVKAKGQSLLCVIALAHSNAIKMDYVDISTSPEYRKTYKSLMCL